MNERLNTIEKLISLVGRINNLVASIPPEKGEILLTNIDEFVPLPSSVEDISKEELDNLSDRITQYLGSVPINDENMVNATIDDEKLKKLAKLMEVIRRQMLILGKQVIDHIR